MDSKTDFIITKKYLQKITPSKHQNKNKIVGQLSNIADKNQQDQQKELKILRNLMSAKQELAGIGNDSSFQELNSKSMVNSMVINNQEEQEQELVKEYFNSLQKENENAQSQKDSKEICGDVVESVCNRIMNSKITIKQNQNDISLDQTYSISLLHPKEIIEKNISKQKLKEQIRVKQILEEKMKFLDQDINKIKNDLTTPKSRNISKEVRELTEEEKKEQMQFLKAKIKERKERDKQRQQRLKDEEEKYKQELERKKQQEEDERKQIQAQKKKEAESRLEDIKRSMQEREEKIKVQNSVLKKVKSQLPLYEKLIQSDLQTENKFLEEKKKRLAEIRDLHKPINPEEIKEHQKKFQENLRALSEKSTSQKEQFHYKRPFVSETYKKIEEERKQKLEILNHPEEEEKKKGPNLLEKIQEYSKTNIKKPKINPLKKQEMQTIIEGLKHKPNYKWFMDKRRDKSESLPSHQINEKGIEGADSQLTQTQKTSDISPRKLGNDYLIKLKENRFRNISVLSNNDSASQNLEKDNPYQQTVPVRQLKAKKLSEQRFFSRRGDTSTVTAQSQSNSSTLLPSKINYLKELRIHNKDARQISEIDRIMKKSNNLNPAQQADQLLLHAEKLEQQALRQEKLLRARGNYHGDYNSVSSLDSKILDTYITAIKTKFAILEQHS